MRVLFISGPSFEAPSVRYRCYHPMEQLELIGWQADVAWVGDPVVHLDHDIVVLQKVLLEDHVERIIYQARAVGSALVYDLDDLILGPDFIRHQAYKHAYTTQQTTYLIEESKRRKSLLSLCDACLVSTQYLAEAISAYGTQPFILRNALGKQDFEIAASIKRHRAAEGGRIVLGYMSGTASHNYDFAEIADVLVSVMDDYPQVYLQITGPLKVSESLSRFGHRVRQLPLVPWEHLYGILASLDINLAPLEMREPFCQAKSEVKYIEAGLVGTPTVASPIGAFQFAIDHGVNGLLAATPGEWRKSLEYLIEAPENIKRLGEAAQKDVQQRYCPSVRAKELKTILEQVLTIGKPGNSKRNISVQKPIAIIRQDLGIPFEQRPPFFPPTRSAIRMSVDLMKRMIVYQSLLRTLWYLIAQPWYVLKNIWRRLRAL